MEMRPGLLLIAVAVIAAAFTTGALAQDPEPKPPVVESPDRAMKVPTPSDGLVWAALIQGTDHPEAGRETKFSDAEKPLLEQMRKAFGFSHFFKLGEHTQAISREYVTWVTPSQELFLKIDSMGPYQNGLKLDIQLWRRIGPPKPPGETEDDADLGQFEVLVKSSCVLRSDSPVLIQGPSWGKDQLLLAVELRGTPESATAMNGK